jgi:ATP-dependent protease ClpP protease subunit
MWHELQTLEIFNLSTPSNKEDEARVLRHLQDTANSWLAEVSNLSKEEVDELVRYKELWVTGPEAVQYGFADGFIGK